MRLAPMGCLFIVAGTPALGQTTSEKSEPPVAASRPSDFLRDVYRFTPVVAGAISKQLVAHMKPQYGLDDTQAAEIQAVFQERLMRFAAENETLNRQLLERFMIASIESQGRFSRDEAMAFGRLANQLMPRLREWVADTSRAVEEKLSPQQRERFRKEIESSSGGLQAFEDRMRRWEAGMAEESAVLFADGPAPARVPSEVPAPDTVAFETARKEAREWSLSHVRSGLDWERQVTRWADYYEFDAAQRAAARGILKDSEEKLASHTTAAWMTNVRKNRLASRTIDLAPRPEELAVYRDQLEREFRRLCQPIYDLDESFKARLDDLPTRAQRVAAQQRVRRSLRERGLAESPP